LEMLRLVPCSPAHSRAPVHAQISFWNSHPDGDGGALASR
jgi:hypothetical protein